MNLSPIDPSRSPRHLMAALHRWMRSNGWQVGSYGWINGIPSEATVSVNWTLDTLNTVDIAWVTGRHASGKPVWSCSTHIRVESVVQAVDVLVALGVLPPLWSSAYALAVERYTEQVESLEEEIARKDRYLGMADDTIAGLMAENRELRSAAAATQFAAIGGAR